MAQRYKWQGWDPSVQQERTGMVEAADEKRARSLVAGTGVLVTSIRPARRKLSEIEFEFNSNKVRFKDVTWLMRTLASTEQAGLPIHNAISMFARQRAGTAVGRMLSDIERDVGEGVSLGVAFRKHEESLGPVVCTLIEVGESSGRLDDSLRRIANYMESQMKLRRQIRGALAYPIAVLSISLLLFMGMLRFVVPMFQETYTETEADLPAATELVLAMSRGFNDMFLYLVMMVLLSIVAWKRSKSHPQFRAVKDRVWRKVPVIGNLLHKTAVARYASAMSAVLSSGEGLLTALQLSGRAANNMLLEEANQKVIEAVTAGTVLSAALEEQEVFGDLMAGLAYVGEQTGQTDELMERFAVISEEEVAVATEQAMSLIEPLSIVIIGGIIGFVVISMYLPMFNIADIIGSS